MVSNIRFHTGNKEMLLQLCSLRIQGGPNLGEKPPPKKHINFTQLQRHHPRSKEHMGNVQNPYMTFHPPWVLLVPSARPYNEKPASLSSLTAEKKTFFFIYPILLVLIWPFSNEHTSLTTFDTWWGLLLIPDNLEVAPPYQISKFTHAVCNVSEWL